MIVLSLFDWISCARVALQRAWIPVEGYYASEVDKYAIKISEKNRPDQSQIGDVRWISYDNWRITCEKWEFDTPPIDLLIWWSPCQDLSIANKNRQWLDGERSWLFREYVRILNETKPKRFILENVASMPKDAQKIITETLGVEPIMINAALVSAQSRKRLFRTNIPGVKQPEDKWILLKDIIQDDVDESYYVNSSKLKKEIVVQKGASFDYYNGKEVPNFKAKTLRTNPQSITAVAWQVIRVWHLNSWWQGDRIYSQEWKSVCLSANGWGRGAKTGLYKIKQKSRWFNVWWTYEEKSPTLTSSSREENNKLHCDDMVRKLTPVECEHLQGLPDDYTEGISNTQRYKCLGNAFNVDVVAHILSFIPRT